MKPFITAQEVMKLLGMSRMTFYRKKAAMEAGGFPVPDPIMKGYSAAAVRKWIAGRETKATEHVATGAKRRLTYKQ